jgi:hypothetical protein
MFVHKKSLLQLLPLIFLLLAGQLQAKTVCLCPMMDMVDKQAEVTYLNGHKDCFSLDCDDTTSLILVLDINQDMKMNILIPDLLAESEFDQSQIKFTTLNLVLPLSAVSTFHGSPHINHVQLGSKIHLITQRLRI